jgi:hypothetical protein
MNAILEQVKGLDPKRAAGVLSRAALALANGEFNPATSPIEPDEIQLRERLIELAKKSLGRGEKLDETQILSRIAEKLEEHAEKLFAPKDESAALERLSLDAVLESDVYSVEFDPSLPDIEEGLPRDRERVEETIRRPDLQENFGPNLTPNEPSAVSLFGRWYSLGRERDRFLLIVAASRQHKTMRVKHYWRVYPSEINIRGAKNLSDVFERFALHYGYEFRAGDWSGKFLRYLRTPPTVKVESPPVRGKSIFFLAIRGGAADTDPSNRFLEFAFGLNVDVSKYEKDVLKHARFENRAHD